MQVSTHQSLSLARCSAAGTARSRVPAASARPNRLRAACRVEASAEQGKVESGKRTAGVLLGCAVVAAAAAGIAEPAVAVAFADGLLSDNSEPNLLSDFYVTFFGEKIDHKVIVEWVVVGQTIGFIGSLVGGWSAKDRKEEVERLNDRLVAVNKQLREQARAAKAPSSAVKAAPSASAASSSNGIGNGNGNGNGSSATATMAAPSKADSTLAEELLRVLRSGKGHLKMRDSVTAKIEFEHALTLARSGAGQLDSPWKAERKALRGLGAAHQQLADYPKALDAMMEVLKISEKMDDDSGVADAIGVIADIYTDKGDLDKAASWYDRYIISMNTGH